MGDRARRAVGRDALIAARRLVFAAALLAIAAIGTFEVLEQTMPDWYARYRYPLHYAWIVRAHAHNYRLDPALLAAVIYTESQFQPDTVSPAGAIGLMQLEPRTAEGIAERTGGRHFVPDDLRNPEINVRYGAWYLQHLEQHYAARPNALDLALAAYNAGEGRVDAWVAATPAGSAVAIRLSDVRAYVAKVRRLQGIYRRAYHHDLGYA